MRCAVEEDNPLQLLLLEAVGNKLPVARVGEVIVAVFDERRVGAANVHGGDFCIAQIGGNAATACVGRFDQVSDPGLVRHVSVNRCVRLYEA